MCLYLAKLFSCLFSLLDVLSICKLWCLWLVDWQKSCHYSNFLCKTTEVTCLCDRGFTLFCSIALIFLCEFQFPDDLLKDSTKVVSALRRRLQALREFEVSGNGDETDIGLFVLADTAYGSCCVDEVGASHASADCVIHYGHTCFSPWVKNLSFWSWVLAFLVSPFSHILL